MLGKIGIEIKVSQRSTVLILDGNLKHIVQVKTGILQNKIWSKQMLSTNQISGVTLHSTHAHFFWVLSNMYTMPRSHFPLSVKFRILKKKGCIRPSNIHYYISDSGDGEGRVVCKETECKELVCQVGYAPEAVSSYGAPSGDCCPQQGRNQANEFTVYSTICLQNFWIHNNNFLSILCFFNV